MNILHTIDQINQRTAGGSAKCAFQLAEAQAKLGNTVSIWTTDQSEQAAPQGVELRCFKLYQFKGGYSFIPGALIASLRHFDIIHLHNFWTPINVLVASEDIPFVIEAHGNAAPATFKRGALEKSLHWQNRKAIVRKAGCCIANSELEAGHYLQAGARAVEVIHPGIDPQEFIVSAPPHSSAYKTVLYLGRLDYNKGVDILIDAFALLNREDTQLKIAGVDYGYRLHLEAKVERLGLLGRVNFVGPLYGRDKAEAYRDADLFVMPSRSEIWGLTFMEALATGTPCIMTEGCGPSSALPVECGRVVKPEPRDMARAIGEMLSQGAANSFRDYRKRWVSQFGWDVIAPRTIRLYREVLAAKCLPHR